MMTTEIKIFRKIKKKGMLPPSDYWKELHFDKLMKNNQVIAVCRICCRQLKNCSKNHFKIHRHKCIVPINMPYDSHLEKISILDGDLLKLQSNADEWSSGQGMLPSSDYWKELHFDKLMKNNQVIAVCRICRRELKNCSQNHFKIHRHKCTVPINMPYDSHLEKISSLDGDLLNLPPNSDEWSSGCFSIETEQIELKKEIIRLDESDEEHIESVQVLGNENHQSDEIHISDDSLPSNGGAKLNNTCILIETKQDSNGENSNCNQTNTICRSATKIGSDGIHSAFAEFFFESNLPFTILHSINFQLFLNTLNRDYELPTLRRLADFYLDKTLENYKIPATEVEQDAILILSGWKHFTAAETTDKYIVACLHLFGDPSRVFLNIWDLDMIDSDGDEADIEVERHILAESKTIAKQSYNATIYAMISDNLNRQGTSSKAGIRWHSTCHSYLAGLLADDLIDRNVSNMVMRVLKEFQNDKCQACIMNDGGGVRITLPWSNRWCTYRDSFQCYVKNNAIIRDLLRAEKCQASKTTRSRIFDDELLRTVKQYVEILKPICQLIYLSQKKNTTLAEMVEEWMKLEVPIEFNSILDQRRNMALNSFAMTANFLHPQYRGRFFTTKQIALIESFLMDSLDTNDFESVAVFKRNEGIFDRLNEMNVTEPREYWNAACREHSGLGLLALQLLRVPVSVSYVDKCFSSHSIVHLPTRNMLGMDAYRKLLKVHFMIKFAEGSEI